MAGGPELHHRARGGNSSTNGNAGANRRERLSELATGGGDEITAKGTASPRTCVRGEPVIYRFHELPQHLAENRFVLSNHRANYTFAECWKSVLFLHSETMNIWTHFLGGLLFTFIAVSLPPHYHFFVRLQAALTGAGFLVSPAAHTFTPISEPLFRLLFKLDRVGVAVFLGGAVLAAMYQCFRCDHEARTMWLIGSVCLVAMASVLNFGPSTNNKKRVLYVLTYSLEVALSGMPVLLERSRLLSNPSAYSAAAAAVVHDNVERAGLAYLFGAIGSVFYASNLPERIRPGSFDYLPGHSLMHIFSVLAVLEFMWVTTAWNVVVEESSCDAIEATGWLW